MTADDQGQPRTVLADPAFRTVYVGIVLTMLGAWMTNVACAWLMTSLSRSAVMLGWLQASFMVPVVVFSLPAAPWPIACLDARWLSAWRWRWRLSV